MSSGRPDMSSETTGHLAPKSRHVVFGPGDVRWTCRTLISGCLRLPRFTGWRIRDKNSINITSTKCPPSPKAVPGLASLDRARPGINLPGRLQREGPTSSTMNPTLVTRLDTTHPLWPGRLTARLGSDAPKELAVLGNVGLLALPMTGLLCSARCPGHVILPTYDRAALWRDTRRCVGSGFHSALEQECLRILLRGTPPIVVCLARALPARIPSAWRVPVEAGNLLLVSCFGPTTTRATTALAMRRNALVAALADEWVFAHVRPGGQLERLARRTATWGEAGDPRETR